MPKLTSSGPVGSIRTTLPLRSNSHVGIAPPLNRPRKHACLSSSRGRCKALGARTDRYCDHVLLQSLVIADASVEPSSEYVDEAILSDYLQANLGISCKKTRHDRR